MRFPIIILFVFVFFTAKSQNLHFSQFSKSSFFLNPSILSFQDKDYQFIIQRRSQWESVAPPFRTLAASLNRKDFSPSHSLGIQFLNDIAGEGIIKTTGIAFNYSKLFKISKNNITSLGVGSGVFQREFSFEDLIFHEEENYKKRTLWFPDINVGITNNLLFNRKTNIITGIALFHLNKPHQSLLYNNEIRLQNKINIHSFIIHKINNRKEVSSKIFFSKQDQNRELVFSGEAEYAINLEKNIFANTGLAYRFGDAIIYNFGTQIDGFKFNISYDINISSLSKASNNMGGFELSIIYIWDLKKIKELVEKEKNKKCLECPIYF